MIVAEWITDAKAERQAWLQSMGKSEKDVEKDRHTGREFIFNEWNGENDEVLIRVWLSWTITTSNLN